MQEIELGRTVKCRVTGFQGVVTARTVSLNGCARLTVQPLMDKDGKYPEAMWIDETIVDYIGNVKVDAGPRHDRGGPSERMAPPVSVL